MRTHALVLVAVVCPMLVACGKKEDKPSLAAPAATLAESKVAPEVKATHYLVDASGTTSIAMPAPKENIKAKTTAAAGTVDVDLANLANLRGSVKIDLATLTTFTFGDKEKDEAQTAHARTWLEAVVEGKVQEEGRFATFAIRSVDGLDAPSAAKIAATQENGEDVRAVKLTVHGELLVHGRKSAKDVRVAMKLHYPAGAPADSAPTRIDIKTVEPFTVVLAEHDVKPRDTFGKVAQGSFHLLGTKVADTASVSIDLTASKAGAS